MEHFVLSIHKNFCITSYDYPNHYKIIILLGGRLWDLHQNNIGANFYHLFPGYYRLVSPAKQSPTFTAARNNQGKNHSGADVNVYVNHKTKTFTVADIDDFFFPQFTKTHKNPPCITV
jgi:hypothetical protein